MSGWKCFACNSEINVEKNNDLGVCNNCLENNKEVFIIKDNIEKFKREFNSLFYADTWEHWYVNAKELDFFNKRWGL